MQCLAVPPPPVVLQTGQMLAALLGWPQATFASKLEVDAAAEKATVTREVDGGLETVSWDERWQDGVGWGGWVDDEV